MTNKENKNDIKSSTNTQKKLSDLGVYKLAEHLQNIINEDELSISEDAILLDDKKSVLSSVSMLEGINFDLTYMPMKHIGYKIVTAALMDILAKNAIPKYIMLEFAFSNKFDLEITEELCLGINIACKHNNIKALQVKTSPAVVGLNIYATAVGETQHYVGRYTANENDLVCTTGDLGAAYAGLLLLEREKAEFLANPNMQPHLEGHDYVLQRYIKPETRLKVIQYFQEQNIVPTSMIVNSAGLATAVVQLCKASKKGCMIYDEKLPVEHKTTDVLESFNIHATTGVLSGGDDYELLFTVSQNDYDKIKDNDKIKVIGHITEVATGTMLVPMNGPLIPIKVQGL
ncbi:thiamine-monophosphate kinase [Bacteroidia bacterium]|nr:thiamine-monophosphate kinase [Bacteroidia bacterium]